MSTLVECPICERYVPEATVSSHLDFGCPPAASTSTASSSSTPAAPSTKTSAKAGGVKKRKASDASALAASSSPASFPSAGKKPRTPSAKAATTTSHLESVKPLPELVRPRALEDFIGQEHLLGKGALLRSLIEADKLGSCLFWGPPGTGKTTIARVIATTTSSKFKELSATSATTADLRAVFTEAENVLKLTGRKTVLFIDEIQRFNKAQQDAFLPVVESGQISLIASTTENPSFRVNTALLSRCRVFVLNKLSTEDLVRVLIRALKLLRQQEGSDIKTEPSPPALVKAEPSPPAPPALTAPPSSGAPAASSSNLPPTPSPPAPGPSGPVSPPAPFSSEIDPLLASDPIFLHTAPLDFPLIRFLAAAADGDARVALSSLELAISAVKATPAGQTIDREELKRALRKAHLQYDRNGEAHYDTISALHKAVRGSDADAALYWLARMLEGGEDPLYVARRCVRMASEDIGTANPQALPQALAAYQSCLLIGMPECDCILAQTIVMLAESPKSVRTYKAYGRAKKLVKETENYPVPLHIRNAPTGLMKSLGYGKEYRYEPGYAHPVFQTFLPPELAGAKFLHPDDSLEGKTVDEAALREWEWKVQGGKRWEGRDEMARKLSELEERDREEAEKAARGAARAKGAGGGV
ncbi:hypothetical protein JCM10207_007564 [Rhodosporidiobolus poonsookiae]